MLLMPSTLQKLFGETSSLSARRKYQKIDDGEANVSNDVIDDDSESVSARPKKGSVAEFFFGFLYEDDNEENNNDEKDLLYISSMVEPSTSIWNPLNAALFLSLTLTTFATAVPVTLVASLSDDLSSSSSSSSSSFAFAPHATAAAVLGTSIGKFINGPVVDVLGARRTCVTYSILLALSLIGLACSQSVTAATWACFCVEFSYSVQWPCVIVTLATHYRGDATGKYEGGIYVTSLAARLGSLIGIPTCSLLLRRLSWRLVALIGAWSAMVASSVTFLHVQDSAEKQNDPQNPIDAVELQKWFPNCYATFFRSGGYKKRLSTSVFIRMIQFIIQTNVIPSVRHVLKSGTFWIVALAHTGASMVRTSERILGTYLYETSNSTLSENRSAGLAVFLSIGTVAGLIVAGNIFAGQQERERKWLVTRLYVMTIASCYTLSLLAMPFLRNALEAPELITTFQVMAVTTAGFGIAVQYYHIPSLVGATFGCDKGLFSAYSDGVACGIASAVWRIVGHVVHGNAHEGGSWVYGWAVVALLLILSAILMVEFMEHYFCRHRYGGTYETIIFA